MPQEAFSGASLPGTRLRAFRPDWRLNKLYSAHNEGMRLFMALLIALVFCATASALTVTHSRRIQAESIALRYWGQTKCLGGISIRSQRFTYRLLAVASFLTTNTGAYEDCEVIFNSTRLEGLSWMKYCATMIHEFGHLDGYPHSTNPRNVMYPALSDRNIPQVCKN